VSSAAFAQIFHSVSGQESAESLQSGSSGSNFRQRLQVVEFVQVLELGQHPVTGEFDGISQSQLLEDAVALSLVVNNLALRGLERRSFLSVDKSLQRKEKKRRKKKKRI
jgi:hypothetical protein